MPTDLAPEGQEKLAEMDRAGRALAHGTMDRLCQEIDAGDASKEDVEALQRLLSLIP